MAKEKKPAIPPEFPQPDETPEVEQPVHPDEPGAPHIEPEILPEEEPEIYPDEEPGTTEPPELPKA